MTDPTALAALHERCFAVPRPFSASEFQTLLEAPEVFFCTQPSGFILGRVTAGEAELLTLAVDPDARRQGIGRALLEAYHQEAAARGAEESFLEVDEINRAARALYLSDGYQEVGRRPAYYRHKDRAPTAAIVLRRAHLRPFNTPIG